MNHFSSITGYVCDEDQWKQIFQVARDNNLMVFSDELYRGSRHDGTTLPSAAATYENAVSLSGVSKVYGLPGIRMGEFGRLITWKTTEKTLDLFLNLNTPL